MFIAKKLRSQSVSAYLIYMYQVEDLIRAYGLDTERIAKEYLPRFGYDEAQMKEAKEWYESLVRMMKEEGKEQTGHLRVVQNTLDLLDKSWLCALKATTRTSMRWRTALMPSTEPRCFACKARNSQQALKPP